jgi:hypothetical protein
MTKFTIILAVAYTISVIAVIVELIIKFSGERDELWEYEWILESSWYTIFSLFIVAVMILMRPNSRSKLLALVEELNENDG